MLNGVTYNIFLGRKFNSLIDWLITQNELQDFYCFQEFPEAKTKYLKALHQMQNYDFTFTPGWKWKGLLYGELTLFKKKKLTIKSTNTISLGGKGEFDFVFLRDGIKIDSAIIRAPINRTAILTRFAYKSHEFTIVNAHLYSDIFNSRKLSQTRTILDVLQNDRRAVIVGDFNYPFGNGLVQLMKNNNFTSALNKTPTFRFLPGVYWQNDYIFQKNCQIKDINVKRIHFSDHYPLFFTLDI